MGKSNNNNNNKDSVHIRRAVAYVVLTLISILCLFWFYVLFVNATKTHAEIQKGFSIVPGKNLLVNWNHVIHGTQPIISGMINSIIISTLSAVLCTYFSAMTAYAIHVYDFKLKKFIFAFILAVMMIPSQVTALGFIRLMDNMHLMDTFIPLIVPTIAAPVTFYYMKQYMESTLPLAIIEAARIDGSGEFHTFNAVILPILKPAMAVQAIFSFVGAWNNYFIPALIINDAKWKTVPILVAQLRSADFLKFDMGKVYMMITIAILPVMIVYLLLSKYIVRGVALGSVKG